MKKTRVIILCGGRSAEHEISLLSARNVLQALDRERYEPVVVGIDKLGHWRRESARTLEAATGDPRSVALDARASAVFEMRSMAPPGSLPGRVLPGAVLPRVSPDAAAVDPASSGLPGAVLAGPTPAATAEGASVGRSSDAISSSASASGVIDARPSR